MLLIHSAGSSMIYIIFILYIFNILIYHTIRVALSLTREKKQNINFLFPWFTETKERKKTNPTYICIC